MYARGTGSARVDDSRPAAKTKSMIGLAGSSTAFHGSYEL